MFNFDNIKFIHFASDFVWRRCRTQHPLNPFMPTVPTFAVRETNVSRHNGGTAGSPLKALREDSALSRTIVTQSLGQQMLNATVGKNGLIDH